MSTDRAQLDKIIAKVQKLMNLADASKNPNEEEASSAARMAQDLMAKYNLDMATIEANGDVTTTSAQGGKREKTKMEGRAMYRWQRELMAEVAKANFCYHWISYRWQAPQQKWSETPRDGFEYSWGETGPNGEQYVKQGKWTKIPYHVLVGREVNVVSARLMFDYLCQAIERLVPIENNAQRLSRWAMSWKEGCSDRIISRLMDRRISQEVEQAQAARQAQAASSAAGGTALALLSDYSAAERDANYELAYGMEPGTLAKRRQEWADGAEQRRMEAERAAQELAEQLANMTPKERERYERELAKEQEKARKEQERWEQRERTRRQQEAQRLDWSAYRSGQAAGDKVGLDTQVGGGSSRGSLKG